jgi:hypothetical protein
VRTLQDVIDRIYVIDGAGKLAYIGGPGPWGFKVQEVPPILEKLFGKKTEK